jgi:hypothetical protein
LGNVTINWGGTGVGTYVSGGEGSSFEYSASALDTNYHSSYFLPCSTTGEIIYLNCMVNVTRANKEAGIMLGSFEGTVAYIGDTIDCGNYITDKYIETTLSGYFKVRWTAFE